mmetsp:Transcript_54146/g.162125  ORF Transcript_54146/g.162125 Transcript_54146/m.162125 type:complete len:346 (+) Transcript_54146:801-1838(+)
MAPVPVRRGRGGGRSHIGGYPSHRSSESICPQRRIREQGGRNGRMGRILLQALLRQRDGHSRRDRHRRDGGVHVLARPDERSRRASRCRVQPRNIHAGRGRFRRSLLRLFRIDVSGRVRRDRRRVAKDHGAAVRYDIFSAAGLRLRISRRHIDGSGGGVRRSSEFDKYGRRRVSYGSTRISRSDAESHRYSHVATHGNAHRYSHRDADHVATHGNPHGDSHRCADHVTTHGNAHRYSHRDADHALADRNARCLDRPADKGARDVGAHGVARRSGRRDRAPHADALRRAHGFAHPRTLRRAHGFSHRRTRTGRLLVDKLSSFVQYPVRRSRFARSELLHVQSAHHR